MRMLHAHMDCAYHLEATHSKTHQSDRDSIAESKLTRVTFKLRCFYHRGSKCHGDTLPRASKSCRLRKRVTAVYPPATHTNSSNMMFPEDKVVYSADTFGPNLVSQL